MIEFTGYSDVQPVGRGGLGDVYRASRDSTGATVAIKVLRDVDDSSVAWRRTRRELTALVALDGHRNVVQVFEVLDTTHGPALVMEYAAGGSIADMIDRRTNGDVAAAGGPLTLAETVLVGRHTAAALTAAHARGIVHRDVKPQNLLIDAYGQVKLCDFGIAALTRTDEFRAQTNAVSMRYASPEDLEGDEEVDAATDVFSLGATLLHLHRGAPPTLRDRMVPWQPVATSDRHCGELDRIIAACLQPDPAARPPASDVADDLERLGWEIDERRASEPMRASRRAARPSGRRVAPVDEDVAGDTVVRVVERPAAEPPRRQRGRWAVAALAVVALAAAWIVRGSPQATWGTTDRPDSIDDIIELEWPEGPVGECLVQLDGVVQAAPCDQPHDLQRTAVSSLALDEPHDATVIERAVAAACERALTAFVGTSVGEFDAAYSAPSPETWAAGDRQYQCFVGVPGERLVGDVRGIDAVAP